MPRREHHEFPESGLGVRVAAVEPTTDGVTPKGDKAVACQSVLSSELLPEIRPFLRVSMGGQVVPRPAVRWDRYSIPRLSK